MIVVPPVILPKTTEIEIQDGRLEIREKASDRKVQELRASIRQPNTDDRESRIAMVLAGNDVSESSDTAARLTTELLNGQAIREARESLKPKLRAAKFEAATAVLAGLKPAHDAVMNRLVTALTDVVTPAYLEIFQLSRDLKDKDCGWRNGVCDLVPALVELFGANNAHSPLASLLHEAVRLGYLKAGQVPKELRA
jgi:hypothetical protein